MMPWGYSRPIKPKKWFIEQSGSNENSNTVKVLIYRHGALYSSAKMTLKPECKDPELEKTRFVNLIKLMYNE